MTDPDDIPVSVTEVVYTVDRTHPTHGVAQNHLAQWFAPYWEVIEAHFREKIAREIEENGEPAPWMYDLGDGAVIYSSWIDHRDGLKAAWIARGRPE